VFRFEIEGHGKVRKGGKTKKKKVPWSKFIKKQLERTHPSTGALVGAGSRGP